MELAFAEKYRRYLSRRRIRSALWLMIGSICVAAAFAFFMNPYRVVPGGVYGLGIVLHELFPSIQVGTFGLMFDIPLLLIALKVFGKRFGGKTFVSAMIIPIIMNAMGWAFGDEPTTMFGGKMDLSNDLFLVCVFGGVFLGGGLGMILKSGATSGGTDIVSMLLVKYARIPFSRGVLMVDSCVVIFGIIVLGDWRLPLYSLVTIFVATRMIDFVVDGASYDKLLFIISDRKEEIREFILSEMDRGGTSIKTTGMYTGQPREMIFLVVSRNEVATIEGMIKHIDPGSFVVVVNAYRTYGDGFKPFPD